MLQCLFRRFTPIFLLLLIPIGVCAQQLDDVIPFDPAVKTGTLPTNVIAEWLIKVGTGWGLSVAATLALTLALVALVASTTPDLSLDSCTNTGSRATNSASARVRAGRRQRHMLRSM